MWQTNTHCRLVPKSSALDDLEWPMCCHSWRVAQTVIYTYCAGDVQYSEKLHKVFVRFDASCPFLFSSSRATPRDCVIRAMPTFVRPQHMHEVVRRCPHHAAVSANNAVSGGPPSDHLIRCDHKLAVYQEDSVTGFHSVVVPYDVPAGDLKILTQFSWLFPSAQEPGEPPAQLLGSN